MLVYNLMRQEIDNLTSTVINWCQTFELLLFVLIIIYIFKMYCYLLG
jgi:type II secretory pathway component PulF